MDSNYGSTAVRSAGRDDHTGSERGGKIATATSFPNITSAHSLSFTPLHTLPHTHTRKSTVIRMVYSRALIIFMLGGGGATAAVAATALSSVVADSDGDGNVVPKLMRPQPVR